MGLFLLVRMTKPATVLPVAITFLLPIVADVRGMPEHTTVSRGAFAIPAEGFTCSKGMEIATQLLFLAFSFALKLAFFVLFSELFIHRCILLRITF